MDVYRSGRVALANAPGTGIADDKVIYAYVPKIIKYYLGEEPILPNVPTYVCFEEDQRRHVLENLDKFVVKAANESGGYGMLVGPHSTAGQREKFKDAINADPRNYIAQPTLSLSRVPVIVDDHFEGRHVDLRPYVLYGKEIFVLPGRPDSCRIEEGLACREFITGRRQQRHVGPRKFGGAMLSRVAESLYWMSRYVERAENVARFIDVNTWLQLDLPDSYVEQWRPVGQHDRGRERCLQSTTRLLRSAKSFDS